MKSSIVPTHHIVLTTNKYVLLNSCLLLLGIINILIFLNSLRRILKKDCCKKCPWWPWSHSEGQANFQFAMLLSQLPEKAGLIIGLCHQAEFSLFLDTVFLQELNLSLLHFHFKSLLSSVTNYWKMNKNQSYIFPVWFHHFPQYI